jgi:hypothetical protein
MSIKAQLLLLDIREGCRIFPNRNGGPCIVMPADLNGPMPRTRGQVPDTAVQELRALNLL